MGNKVSQFDYAEPHPICCKYSERRVQRRTETEIFGIDYAEPLPYFKTRKANPGASTTEVFKLAHAEPHLKKIDKKSGRDQVESRSPGSIHRDSPGP